MITRRAFLSKSSAALAAGLFLPSVSNESSMRAAGRVSPSDKIRVGLIGCKSMGWSNLHDFLLMPEIECVALCDVDRWVLGERRKSLAELRSRKAELLGDYRRMLDRKDLDVVIIGTPDHWHCLQMVDAVSAGKDVYVEKPIANSIAECDAMVSAARRYGRVVQVGQQQRSGRHWKEVIGLIRSGKLGSVARIDIWANFGYAAQGKPVPNAPVPKELDYEMWLGPAPSRPYNEARLHGAWRMFWDYGGGLMTDWGVHLIDMALWAMDVTGMPRSVSGSGGAFAYPGNVPETFDTQDVTYHFDGFNIHWSHTAIESGPYGRNYGLAFKGTAGTLVVNREGWELIPESGSGLEACNETVDTASYNEHVEHVRNFIDCVKRRDRDTACPIETGSLCAKYAHLGNIAARSGLVLRYDEENRTFGHAEADRYLKPEYRTPWQFPKM